MKAGKLPSQTRRVWARDATFPSPTRRCDLTVREEVILYRSLGKRTTFPASSAEWLALVSSVTPSPAAPNDATSKTPGTLEASQKSSARPLSAPSALEEQPSPECEFRRSTGRDAIPAPERRNFLPALSRPGTSDTPKTHSRRPIGLY